MPSPAGSPTTTCRAVAINMRRSVETLPRVITTFPPSHQYLIVNGFMRLVHSSRCHHGSVGVGAAHSPPHSAAWATITRWWCCWCGARPIKLVRARTVTRCSLDTHATQTATSHKPQSVRSRSRTGVQSGKGWRTTASSWSKKGRPGCRSGDDAGDGVGDGEDARTRPSVGDDARACSLDATRITLSSASFLCSDGALCSGFFACTVKQTRVMGCGSSRTHSHSHTRTFAASSSAFVATASEAIKAR